MMELALDDRVRVEALLSEYGWRLDHGGDVGDLFTSEGLLLASSIGVKLSGREEISSHFAAHANPSRTTCHSWCALRIQESTGDIVRLTTIQTTFLRLPGEAPTVKHVMVGNTYDTVRRDQDGQWRFLERRLEVLFPFDVRLGA